MFKSCHYGSLPAKIIIIDTDFTEIFESSALFLEEGLGTAIVEIYEKRKLPVAKNLFLALTYAEKNIKLATMEKLINWNKNHNPKFSKYEKDFNMYILFS